MIDSKGNQRHGCARQLYRFKPGHLLLLSAERGVRPRNTLNEPLGAGRELRCTVRPRHTLIHWDIDAASRVNQVLEHRLFLRRIIAFHPVYNFCFGFLDSHPAIYLDPLAGFKIFVVLEEMRDLRTYQFR
ncbi:hypothetical protein C8R31_101234 [Nitrosospira sp. Nsp2]|nr:hypothetical protein C8R31_101234 [Nitrosospira sp. Nsp2]